MRIRTRLWLMVTALLALVLAGNAATVLTIELKELNLGFEREAASFAVLAGPQALRAYGERGRKEGDPEVTAKLAAIARGLPNLKALELFSGRGRLLASHSRSPSPLPPPQWQGAEGAVRTGSVTVDGEECLELLMPVHGTPDSPSVLFRLVVSRRQVDERIRSLYLAFGASLGMLLIFGALVAQKIARHILSPVESLKAAALGLRDGELSIRAQVEGGDEIAELARAFNDMAGRIERESGALAARNAEVERAYAELQALQEELSRLEKFAAVGRTAASVSHEIDNPIGVILGTANMLARELRGMPEIAEDVALIESECLRVRRIVRDLLDFARPAAAGGEERADLGAAVGLVLRGLKHHPELREVNFTVSLPEEPVEAAADPDSVKQVVLNLLLNAARASGYRGEVEIAVRRRGGMVEIEVGDRGVGVPEGDLERIFTPFYTTGKGAGLGLPVSRRLVEGAAGRLTAQNREGGGSIFIASLPEGNRG